MRILLLEKEHCQIERNFTLKDLTYVQTQYQQRQSQPHRKNLCKSRSSWGLESMMSRPTFAMWIYRYIFHMRELIFCLEGEALRKTSNRSPASGQDSRNRRGNGLPEHVLDGNKARQGKIIDEYTVGCVIQEPAESEQSKNRQKMPCSSLQGLNTMKHTGERK